MMKKTMMMMKIGSIEGGAGEPCPPRWVGVGGGGGGVGLLKLSDDYWKGKMMKEEGEGRGNGRRWFFRKVVLARRCRT